MRIAAFNGFSFHDEMFGYIIYFCQLKKFELTLYCRTEVYNDHMEFYKNHFKDFKFNIYDSRLFSYQKYSFDYIFLITDDDPNFLDNDIYINNITIRIDHSHEIRREKIKNALATRPFAENYRQWAIPCYPIIYSNSKQNLLRLTNDIHIIVLGSNYGKYDVSIINRLISKKDCNIIIHAISRTMEGDAFEGLDNRYQLLMYKNIAAGHLIELLKNATYALTDISHIKYEKEVMAGVIPLAFSTLTPLIISEQSNKYYNFKNAIVFDKHSKENIELVDINNNELELERQYLMEMFHSYF